MRSELATELNRALACWKRPTDAAATMVGLRHGNCGTARVFDGGTERRARTECVPSPLPPVSQLSGVATISTLDSAPAVLEPRAHSNRINCPVVHCGPSI